MTPKRLPTTPHTSGAYSPQEKRPRSTKQQNMPTTFNFEQVLPPLSSLFAEATIFNTRQKWGKKPHIRTHLSLVLGGCGDLQNYYKFSW
jgi:hypothetical protein